MSTSMVTQVPSMYDSFHASFSAYRLKANGRDVTLKLMSTHSFPMFSSLVITVASACSSTAQKSNQEPENATIIYPSRDLAVFYLTNTERDFKCFVESVESITCSISKN